MRSAHFAVSDGDRDNAPLWRALRLIWRAIIIRVDDGIRVGELGDLLAAAPVSTSYLQLPEVNLYAKVMQL